MGKLQDELVVLRDWGRSQNPLRFEAKVLPYLQALIKEGLRVHPETGCSMSIFLLAARAFRSESKEQRLIVLQCNLVKILKPASEKNIKFTRNLHGCSTDSLTRGH